MIPAKVSGVGRTVLDKVGFEMFSVVALLEDLLEDRLIPGEVGTVVEMWAPEVYEVEFSDNNGETYAMATLKAEQLMRLHHGLPAA